MSEPPVDPQHHLSSILLGGEPRYRKAEIAALAGVELQRAEKLWQSMGFSHVDNDVVVFTDADLAALRMLVDLVSAEVITPELETAVARALAQTMARLATWQIGIFQTVLGGSLTENMDATIALAQTITPDMAQLQDYVWRRHLAAAAARELDDHDVHTQVRNLVIGFADIVGYTTLIREYDESELAKLIDDFESIATSVVAENHGRIVKTVGDEVLFEVGSAEAAAEIGLRLHEEIAAVAHVPPLRVGIAQGPVLGRFGDVYGSTVNIASRLTSLAKPASVLVDVEVANTLKGNSDYDMTPIGPTKVQGFRGLRAWVLRRGENEDKGEPRAKRDHTRRGKHVHRKRDARSRDHQ